MTEWILSEYMLTIIAGRFRVKGVNPGPLLEQNSQRDPVVIDQWVDKSTRLEKRATIALLQARAELRSECGLRDLTGMMATGPSATSTESRQRQSNLYFRGPVAVVSDPLHSKREERFKAIGKTDKVRGIFVVFTVRMWRGKRLIRPISARYMHRKEMDHYEKETATIPKR